MIHTTAITVRFADIDQLGHVNNAKYLTYFEQARIRYFEEVVRTPVVWTEKGVILARAELNFLLPVKLNDPLTVETQCTRIGNKSFDLSYQLFSARDDKKREVASGMTVMVCYDYTAGETIAIPQEWKDRIEKFEGSKDL